MSDSSKNPMYPRPTEQQAVAALDEIARLILSRCHALADWGGDKPYDGVLLALERRILVLTTQNDVEIRA